METKGTTNISKYYWLQSLVFNLFSQSFIFEFCSFYWSFHNIVLKVKFSIWKKKDQRDYIDQTNYLMLEPLKDNCSEFQEHGWLNYWTERNILINLLAILIIAANICLIFIILRSPKLRAEVRKDWLICKARKVIFCFCIYILKNALKGRNRFHKKKMCFGKRGGNKHCDICFCNIFVRIIKRFNLVILSLAITDLLCGFLIPFDTLRKHRWGFFTVCLIL